MLTLFSFLEREYQSSVQQSVIVYSIVFKISYYPWARYNVVMSSGLSIPGKTSLCELPEQVPFNHSQGLCRCSEVVSNISD